MSKWVLLKKHADFEQIAREYHIDPVIARILRNRDVISKEEIQNYLSGTRKEMHPYSLLKDMNKTICILTEKIKEKKSIRIIGDYDVDGICATYILFKALTLCGANVDTVIPERIKDGYGISDRLIKEVIDQKIDTILTCDNGIAERDNISLAKSHGITCLITDHHEVPYDLVDGEKKYLLPEADAVVDPKQPECQYPFKGLCGAAVAFKLSQGLFEQFGIEDCYQEELLELAGIATICDVMELTNENRILVKAALQSLAHAHNYGIKALIQVNQLEPEQLSSYQIGFVIGPCINASGRLETAELSLELLKSKAIEAAMPIATQLKNINSSRKEMTEKGFEEACLQIEKEQRDRDKVIVVFAKTLQESLAGIVAGRLREKYDRPVFVLTKGEGQIKGSGRSIEAYSMYDELCKCKECLIQFGGHKMAAGLSMEEDCIDSLREKLNKNCDLTEEDFQEKVVIDVDMPISYVTVNLIRQLSLLEPFGPGNSKPIFAQRGLRFKQGIKMGNGKMARFSVEDETGNTYPFVLFRNLDRFEACVIKHYGEEALKTLFSKDMTAKSGMEVRLSVVYYPSINEYRGNRQIQFILQDYQV